MKRSQWIGVTLLLCLAVAAAPDGVQLSFTPYSAISARRVETMRFVKDGKLDAAESLLAGLQQSYERKEVDEFAVGTAFAAFSTSDETLGDSLDRWVTQKPESWCARLARARYGRARFYRLQGAESVHSDAAVGGKRLHELAMNAIADYKAALAKSPRVMVAYSDLVEMAAATGDAALLRETVTTALRLDPATWLVRDALFRIGGVSEAQFPAFLADAESHVKENPLLLQLRSDLLLQKARGMWRKGDLEGALAIFESQAKSLDTFQIHKERARLLRVLKRYDEARQAIDHAIALLPGKYDGYRERGWLGIDTNQIKAAHLDFRHGLEIEPLDPELNWGLGTALERAGYKPGAMKAYELSARYERNSEVLAGLERLGSRPPAAPRR